MQFLDELIIAVENGNDLVKRVRFEITKLNAAGAKVRRGALSERCLMGYSKRTLTR